MYLSQLLPPSICVLLWIQFSQSAAQRNYGNITESFATAAPNETCIVNAAAGQTSWNARIIEVNVATVYYALDPTASTMWSKSHSWDTSVSGERIILTQEPKRRESQSDLQDMSRTKVSGKSIASWSRRWANSTIATVSTLLLNPAFGSNGALSPNLQAFISSIENQYNMSSCSVHLMTSMETTPISTTINSDITTPDIPSSAATLDVEKTVATYLSLGDGGNILPMDPTTSISSTPPIATLPNPESLKTQITPAPQPSPKTTNSPTPEAPSTTITAVLVSPSLGPPSIFTTSIGSKILPVLNAPSDSIASAALLDINSNSMTYGKSGTAALTTQGPATGYAGGVVITVVGPPLPSPSSVIVTEGKTLTPGGTAFVSGTTYMLPAGASSAMAMSLPSSIVIAGNTLSRSGIVMEGKTLTPGGIIAISSVTYTLGTASLVPAVIKASSISFETEAQGSGFVAEGKTITPGGAIVLSSTTFTLPMGSSTPVIISAISTVSFERATVGSGLVAGGKTITPGGAIVLSSTTFTLPLGSSTPVVISAALTVSFERATVGSGLVAGGQTLTPGGTLVLSSNTFTLPIGSLTPAIVAATPTVSLKSPPQTAGPVIIGKTSTLESQLGISVTIYSFPTSITVPVSTPSVGVEPTPSGNISLAGPSNRASSGAQITGGDRKSSLFRIRTIALFVGAYYLFFF
ncbi:hypothetical protein G7Y89_g7444 [Cudoniella acicularis]|uniref:Uncharacterized protein n=1 Tax=Cudoniella acicularis TaxID=354080 RepID=A0A8H4RIG0_9HELO|nr:hypothetical protein G7Y89_g7444 [Cudoniella acicularis]